MALPDKLYELRKESGLSQESLAEELGVSRQAISKWESGKAMPESDKLILISGYFDVSLDVLLKGDEYGKMSSEALRNAESRKKVKKVIPYALIFVGAAGILYWMMAVLICPSFYDDIAYSSAITVGGNGIYLILCAVIIAAGLWLLFRKNKERE